MRHWNIKIFRKKETEIGSTTKGGLEENKESTEFPFNIINSCFHLAEALTVRSGTKHSFLRHKYLIPFSQYWAALGKHLNVNSTCTLVIQLSWCTSNAVSSVMIVLLVRKLTNHSEREWMDISCVWRSVSLNIRNKMAEFLVQGFFFLERQQSFISSLNYSCYERYLLFLQMAVVYRILKQINPFYSFALCFCRTFS